MLAFLSGLAALLVLYLGGREVVAGRITLGRFVAFTVYIGMLNWPMVALRLGHRHLPARPRLVGAHRRGARRAARGPAPQTAASAPRRGAAARPARAAARWSSGT